MIPWNNMALYGPLNDPVSYGTSNRPVQTALLLSNWYSPAGKCGRRKPRSAKTIEEVGWLECRWECPYTSMVGNPDRDHLKYMRTINRVSRNLAECGTWLLIIPCRYPRLTRNRHLADTCPTSASKARWFETGCVCGFWFVYFEASRCRERIFSEEREKYRPALPKWCDKPSFNAE